MQKLKFMNSKEVKTIIRGIEQQYGCQIKIEKALLKSPKDKVYMISKDLTNIKENSLRINNLGMYFCKIEKDGVRLSIEGAQLVTPRKNFIEVNNDEALAWMRGEDIRTDKDVKGYIIVRHNSDTLGCGKHKEGRILNSVPKERRIKSSA